MHTLSRLGDGTYSVGYYVINDTGHNEWVRLFYRMSFATAMVTVASLNGGGSPGPDLLKILEKCQ